jgi:hypothetical protein
METVFQEFILAALYVVCVGVKATDVCCGRSTLFRSEADEINVLTQPTPTT